MPGLPEEATVQVVDDSVAARWAEWAAGSGARGRSDPYYADARCRFELRDDDVLCSVGDVSVVPAECGVAISSARVPGRLTVCGVTPRDVSAVFAAIDGTRTTSQVRAAAQVSDEAWKVLWEQAFGSLVLAPLSVSDLDQRVSAAEIVRYPGSPYEIVRAYWTNMGDVAERLEAAEQELETAPGFTRVLRELNVLALVGTSGRSFYLPASPVTAHGRVRPGELWATASVVEPSPGSELRFVSGPRVNAPPIGGAAYQRLLMTTLAEPDARAPRESGAAGGLGWGGVVVARAEGDERAAPWFCPPRPFELGHFEALCAVYKAARSAAARADGGATVNELASFHRSFIRLHPFRAGNQCLAMSLVNHVLRKSHGGGMPHLVLDHLALQLEPGAYARAFTIAVREWLVSGVSSVERHLELMARRDRCFDFLRRLDQAANADAATALVAARPGDAGLVFIDSPFPRR